MNGTQDEDSSSTESRLAALPSKDRWVTREEMIQILEMLLDILITQNNENLWHLIQEARRKWGVHD